jgi:hypothetical protein
MMSVPLNFLRKDLAGKKFQESFLISLSVMVQFSGVLTTVMMFGSRNSEISRFKNKLAGLRSTFPKPTLTK